MAEDTSWRPIEPLTDEELSAGTTQFDSLNSVWQDSRLSLEQDSGEAFREFQAKLRRSWSIETGILENLFLLSRGTTQTLIDHGFRPDLIDRSTTDTDPSRLVEILKDHLSASDLIQGLIEDNRPLTLHFIRELHSLLTRHQEYVESVDSLGRAVRGDVVRGQWQSQPSWRTTSSGEEIFYCPPEQIASQMQDLVDFLGLQEDENRNVCLIAAWLHHRFTYIHPFQDGNGRVARALVNYIFVKAHLFPVVVDREQKSSYLDALEFADAGDIAKLADLFASKQIDAIKRALSLVEVTTPEESNLVKDLARGVLERRRKRQEVQTAQFRTLNIVLKELAELAKEHLVKQTVEFAHELYEGGLSIDVNVASGGPEEANQRFYRWEVIESAKQAEQWANFDEESRWVRALVDGPGSRLRFIVSFHHVGRALTGIGEVTAIADLEGTDPTPDTAAAVPNRRPVYCMIRPFSLTWQTIVSANEAAFVDWLQECFAIALREWAETI